MAVLDAPSLSNEITKWLAGDGTDNALPILKAFWRLSGEERITLFKQLCMHDMRDEAKNRKLVTLLFMLGCEMPWLQLDNFNHLCACWRSRLTAPVTNGLRYDETMLRCLRELTFTTK